MTTPKCADILRSALRRPPLLFCLRGGRRYANCSAGRGRGYRSTTPPTSSTTTTATTTATAGDVVRRTRRRLRGVAITGTEEAVRRAEEMVLRLSGEAAGDGASDGGGGVGAGNAFGDGGFVAGGAPRLFEPPGAFYVTHPPPPPSSSCAAAVGDGVVVVVVPPDRGDVERGVVPVPPGGDGKRRRDRD